MWIPDLGALGCTVLAVVLAVAGLEFLDDMGREKRRRETRDRIEREGAAQRRGIADVYIAGLKRLP